MINSSWQLKADEIVKNYHWIKIKFANLYSRQKKINGPYILTIKLYEPLEEPQKLFIVNFEKQLIPFLKKAYIAQNTTTTRTTQGAGFLVVFHDWEETTTVM